MNLQAITDQLYMVNGVVQHEGDAVPGLYAQPAPADAARGRENDTLLLHITLSGQLDETAALHNLLTQLFAKRFFGSAGSITAALRESANATNDYLLSHNRSNEVRREGAMIAAVLREQELFMVQIGEAFAFIGHNFGLEPIPPEKPEEITPIGQVPTLDLRFFHNWLQPDDLLMLADPRIGHLPNQAFVQPLVGKSSKEAQPELQRLLHRHTARLMLITFSETGQSTFIAPKEVEIEAVDSAETVASASATIIPADENERIAEIRRQRREALAAKRDDPPLREAEPEQITLSPTPQTLQDQPTRKVPVRDIPPNPAALPPKEDTLGHVGDGIERGARTATAGVAGRLADGLRWLAEMLSALRQPKSADEDAPASEPIFAMMIAIFIPIIVGLIVSSIFIRGGQRSNLSVIRQEMQTSLQQAGSAEPAEAREFYKRVLELAEESQAIVEDDASIVTMRDAAREQLDDLDNVLRLSAEILYQYAEDVNLTSIAIGTTADGARHLFVHDDANDAIYRHDVDRDYNLVAGDPQRVIASGDTIQTHVVGDIIDLAWKPSNSETRDALVVLDAKGAALSYFPTDGDRLAAPLGLASDWGSPSAIGTYISRLYVLDNGSDQSGAQLWRYLPTGNGFQINSDSRSIILPDLESAVDFVINPEDASILTLYNDGRFRRYRSGRLMWDETTLAEQGFAEPLISPSAVRIVGTGLPSRIYVLDPGSNRLVEISFAGRMLTQLRADIAGQDTELFDDATDFIVLENPLRIIVVNKNFIAMAQRDSQ